MEALLLGWGPALWLGILTSISPCPLATNLAAMSYIGKELGSPRRALLTGVSYTLGRTLAYAALAALLSASVFVIPDASFFLEMYMNKALGPLLILAGILLLEVIPLRFSASCVSNKAALSLGASGLLGAGLLGMLFALSFCPVSAALFFGSLLPLALRHGSPVALPSLYGIGTGLPVFVFAVLLALGAQWATRAFHRVVGVEKWARRVTAAVFILVGTRFCLIYIFEVQL
ncbi:MAG: sulfite exporter TauE/SafE family protein [Bryobacterales bacterium]|nr:sulfite exporter TauE/SafE family protein [Bryobacterales bacterium]